MNKALISILAGGLLASGALGAGHYVVVRVKRPTANEWKAALKARIEFDRVVEDFLTRAAALGSGVEIRAALHKGLGFIDQQREADETQLRAAQGSLAPYGRQQATEPPIAAEGKAYVLMVFEKDGLYTSTAASEDRAFQDLVEYVRKKWQGGYYPTVPFPSTSDQIVDKYFEMRGDDEGYEILEQDILRP